MWYRRGGGTSMGAPLGHPEVRPPAVAGSFYAADPQRLAADVAGLLATVPPRPGALPKALIAPHAGYLYSGAVAAAAAPSAGAWPIASSIGSIHQRRSIGTIAISGASRKPPRIAKPIASSLPAPRA